MNIKDMTPDHKFRFGLAVIQLSKRSACRLMTEPPRDNLQGKTPAQVAEMIADLIIDTK